MNGTHQVLAYADDVNLIGDDIKTIERNADVLLNACKDIGLAVNTGELSPRKLDLIEAWMQMSIWGYVVIPMKKLKTFKYLSHSVTNQNSIQD